MTVVELLSTLGLGALFAVFVQQAVQLYMSRRQHRHELELRRLDAEQRRREDRLVRLRQDLRELMYALFEVEKALNRFHAGDARAAGEPKSPEALEVIERLTERREAARAGLLLDPDGQRLYEVFQELLGKLDRAQAAAQFVQKVWDERGVGPELNLRLDEFYEASLAVREDMHSTIQRAQKLLQEIAAPPGDLPAAAGGSPLGLTDKGPGPGEGRALRLRRR